MGLVSREGRYDGRGTALLSILSGWPLLSSVRNQLNSLNLRAQKGFGQHFLIDRGVLLSIIEAAELERTDTVIEVGPGLGILTRELAGHAGCVAAIEVDRGLVAFLNSEMVEFPNVRILEGDILKTPVSKILEYSGTNASAYKVVANLPYYITTPVIHHFLGSELKPKSLVIMMQQEVAESIMAVPDQMSLLAVTVQYYARIKRIRIVKPGAFYPPPRVSSMIIRLDLLEHPAVDVDDAERFFSLVKAGFSSKRKQLHNSIAHRLEMDVSIVNDALLKSGIDPKRRAETLTLNEWASLYHRMENHVNH